jgi:hypothetical protein
MKRFLPTLILVAMFISVPLISVFGQSVDTTVGGLSPLLYIIVTLGLTIGSSVLTMLGAKAGPFGATVKTLMNGIKSNYISYDKVDAAVSALLKNIGVPAAFGAWAADIVAKILTTIPDSSPSPKQVTDVAATHFAALPLTQANALTAHQIPASMLAATFAKKRIATELLAKTPVIQKLGGTNAVSV